MNKEIVKEPECDIAASSDNASLPVNELTEEVNSTKVLLWELTDFHDPKSNLYVNKNWCCLSWRVEQNFFLGLEKIINLDPKAANCSFEFLTVLISEVLEKNLPIKESRDETRYLLVRCVLKVFDFGYELQSPYHLLLAYFEARAFAWEDMMEIFEQRVESLIPDFEGENEKFLFGYMRETVPEEGVFNALRTISPLYSCHSQYYVKNQLEMYLEALLLKTDWTFEKYVSVLEECGINGKLITHKLEETLLIRLGRKSSQEAQIAARKIKELTSCEDFYYLFFRYGKNPVLQEVARDFCRSKLINYDLFNLYMGFKFAVNENSNLIAKETLGAIFDYRYLGHKYQIKMGKKTNSEDKISHGNFEVEVVVELLKYVQSRDCRAYLNNILKKIS